MSLIREDDRRGRTTRTAVAEKLCSLGIPTKYSTRKSRAESDYSVWNVRGDSSIWCAGDTILEPLWGLDGSKLSSRGSHGVGEWQVEVEGQRYAYADLELISPIFRAHEDDVHTWAEQVRAVLDAVTNGEFRSCVNATCGLHVHVGRGKIGFSETEARQIAAAVTMLERRMDWLHPPDRRRNGHANSLRDNYKIEDLSTRKAFDAIMETKNLAELINLLHKDRNFSIQGCKVSLLPLAEGLKTVEFRQHEGTLSASQIQSWVWLVTNIVSSAVGMDKDELGRIADEIQMLEEAEGRAQKERHKSLPKVSLDPLFKEFVQRHARSLRSYYEPIATENQNQDSASH